MYIKLHFLACMPYLCTKGELAYCLLWEKTWYFAIYRILLVMRTLPWTNTSILDLVSISDTWIAIAPSSCLSATTFLALGVCLFFLYTGNIHFWIHVRFIIHEPYCKRWVFFGHLGRSSNLLYWSRSRTQNKDIQEHRWGGRGEREVLSRERFSCLKEKSSDSSSSTDDSKNLHKSIFVISLCTRTGPFSISLETNLLCLAMPKSTKTRSPHVKDKMSSDLG